MTSQEVLSDGFTKLLGDASDSIRIRYFTQTVGSVWDDEVTLTQAGVTGSSLQSFVVSGDSVPDINGTYLLTDATQMGQPTYYLSGGSVTWVARYAGAPRSAYIIATAPATVLSDPLWKQASGPANPIGTYLAETIGGAAGSGITDSGDLSGDDRWVSGIVQPVTAPEGSTEAVLVNQGKLSTADTRLYVNGSIAFNGSTFTVDVMVGSPAGDLYSTIQGGVDWPIASTPVYTKQYIRRLTGSLSDNQ